jgi:hypothetical protein
MTSSADEPLRFTDDRPDPDQPATQPDDKIVEPENELASGGYDDRQESLRESDQDLFARREENPDARYRPEDHPRSEPRKQPRHT